MADASASAKADFDFFSAVQASNVPQFGEGAKPDPVVQEVRGQRSAFDMQSRCLFGLYHVLKAGKA